ncbi:MAG: hypothetical protein RLZ47_1436 [Bacteroidota bacterium]|jgi:hypothetical protein
MTYQLRDLFVNTEQNLCLNTPNVKLLLAPNRLSMI